MSSIKYFYIRSKNPKTDPKFRGDPIACVAYRREPDPDIQGEDIVTFAISIANPKDEFTKARARVAAAGRLESSRTSVDGFNVASDAKHNEVVYRMMNNILDFGVVCLRKKQVVKVPARIEEAISRWLYPDKPMSKDDEIAHLKWQLAQLKGAA